MPTVARLFARRRFTIAPFDLSPLAFELESAQASEAGPAVLQPTDALRTAGELVAAIERHLSESGAAAQAPVDAADELHEALAELRRSMR